MQLFLSIYTISFNYNSHFYVLFGSKRKKELVVVAVTVVVFVVVAFAVM